MTDTRTDAEVIRDILARSMEWQEKYYARGDEIVALERQRDDLLAANNRYLERARKAEAALTEARIREEAMERRMNAQLGIIETVTTSPSPAHNPPLYGMRPLQGS